MAANHFNPALLKNLHGAHLPPVALSVPGELQFCVDAGVSAAVCFFDDMTVVGLHDHIAVSMQSFLHSLECAIARETESNKEWLIERKQRCVDAFGAGYLGRIQQELRLFRDAPTEQDGSCAGRRTGFVN